MAITQIFYKGTFTGLYNKVNENYKEKFVFSSIHWTYLKIESLSKIENFDIEGNKTADYWFASKILNKKDFHPLKNETEVFIPRGENMAYSGDLLNVLIKNLKINFNQSAPISSRFFEASGDIYFQIEIAKELPPAKPAAATIFTGANIVKGDHTVLMDATTNVNIDPILVNPLPVQDPPGCGSLFSRRPASVTNLQFPSTDPLANSKNKGCSNSIGTILWILVLMVAFSKSLPIFYVLLAVSILWGITRFFFKNILGRIFTFILIVVLAFFALSYVFKKGKEILPEQTKSGSIKVDPPREGDKKPGSNEKDLISDKSINWFDFKNSNYQADYSTSSLSFLATQNKHQALVSSINANSSVDYFNQVYQGLNNYDSKKVDELVDVFKDSAKRMNLNSLQLAEMVTTFIQEIPYVLVHDGSCAEAASSGGFVREWHQDSKPCLAKIPAGVQSPYEFMHNLKGDCDTRTLLAFTILKKLKIPASIWVSEAYGHSILGIGLPFASGFHKEVSGVNHYSVELTSKCRIGFVSPDQNEESNWDIALYYQP